MNALQDFKTVQHALNWMLEQINSVNVSNHRFAYHDDCEALQQYFVDQFDFDGNSFDQRISINGKIASIGCHYI